MPISLILLVVALVLFVIAGVGVAADRFNLVAFAFGLASWVLSLIIG